MPNPKTELPATLGALLRVALKDARGLDHRKYVPIAIAWHDSDPTDEDTRCGVCLGGAVMAGSLDAKTTDELTPDDYPAETRNRLLAIECARDGRFLDAHEYLGARLSAKQHDQVDAIDPPTHQQFRSWPQFNQFCKGIERIATELEAIGL